MRILVVHAWYRDGDASGENRVARQESEHLRAAGHDVELHTVDNKDIEDAGARQKLLLPARMVRSSPARASLRETIARFRPDVVHVHNTYPALSPSVFLACRDAGVPSVATLHNYRAICAKGVVFRNGARCTDCVGTSSLPAILHGCARDSRLFSTLMAVQVEANLHVWRDEPTLLIALSRAMRDVFVQAGFRPDRIVVKGNMAEDRAAPRSDEPRAITFLGRLVDEKGVPFLRQAWDLVAPRARAAGVELVLAGAGPLEDMVTDWAASEPSVRYVGPQSAQACRDLVGASLAVVVPSRWQEPFGLVAIEAMCGGVPPITPDDGSFPDLIRQGVDGLRYRQGDPASLAAALLTVIDDRESARRMGDAARRTYEARFTPESNVRALEAVYALAIDRAMLHDLRAYAR
jgi:glycosyltransferase involved in cell wall biosynthesis